MRTALLPLSLALAACGGGEKPPSGADDTAATPDDTQPPDDSGGIDCPASLTIAVAGDPAPGAAISLSIVEEDPNIWDVEWEPSAGEIAVISPWEVTWYLPADAAIDGDETLTVEARAATPEECENLTATAEATVSVPETARVIAIYNPSIAGSEDVARYYAGFRGLSDAQLCAAPSADATTLAAADLAAWLAAVEACIAAVGPQVQYLVPVYGVPYKVSGQINDIAYETLTTTSLDALLVYGEAIADQHYAIYSPLYRDGSSLDGEYDPYVPFGELRADLRAAGEPETRLVTRIDGADAAAAMALVDRTAEAEALAAAGALAGTVYVDGRYGDTPPAIDDSGSYEYGEWNIYGVKRLFEELGWYPVVWDGNEAEFGTKPAPTWCEDALYYAGWYSYYNYNAAFEWAPGAIGGHLDSCSACDIRSGAAWSGGALQAGITATFGAVNEPYVIGMPEYDQLFLYLTQGANFAEAAYESTVVGLWMMTYVGDPLYRPYPN